MPITPLYRTVVNFTRRQTHKSLLATAATASVLGVAGASAAIPLAHHGSVSTTQAAHGQASQPSVSAAVGKQIAAQLDSLQVPSGAGSASGTSQSAAPHPAAPHKAQAHKAPAHKAVAHKTAAHKAVAHKHTAKNVHKKAGHAKPYLIYDSVTPSAIPSGKSAAVYSNGPYAASAGQVSGHKSVLWIDTNGSNPSADALDVEPTDATPAGAAQWVKAKLSAHPHSTAIVYTMRSEWGAVKYHVSHLPKWMQSHVRYWIADPTGVPHIVPGADATQWYWGQSYDITTANPGFTG